MAVTIRDVAKLAGVSHQTVSRAINNSSSIKESTKEKVFDAIKMLNYYPNNSAQNLQKKIVNAIGFTYPNNATALKEGFFYSTVISEICSFCEDYKVFLNLIKFNSNKESVDLLIQYYSQKIISGIIMTSPTLNIDSLAELVVKGIPLVIIGRPPAGIRVSYVDNDNMALCEAAANYLLSLGHRNIGMINGPYCMTMCQDVQNGFTSAFQKHNIFPSPDWSINVALNNRDPYNSTIAFLQNHPQVTALICIDEMVTMSVMEAAAFCGKRVPEDISIISLNYNDWNRYLKPPLTGFYKNPELLGRNAMAILMDMIYNQAAPSSVLVPYEFKEGGTCRPCGN